CRNYPRETVSDRLRQPGIRDESCKHRKPDSPAWRGRLVRLRRSGYLAGLRRWISPTAEGSYGGIILSQENGSGNVADMLRHSALQLGEGF
ncbi:MAG: hypothetical protein DRI57_11185, partial [Deltaproteobacteria bacterium]